MRVLRSILILLILLIILSTLNHLLGTSDNESNSKDDNYTVIGEYLSNTGITSEIRVYDKTKEIKVFEYDSIKKKYQLYLDTNTKYYDEVPTKIMTTPKENDSMYKLDIKEFEKFYKETIVGMDKKNKRGVVKEVAPVNTLEVDIIKGIAYTKFLTKEKGYRLKSKYVSSDFVEYYYKGSNEQYDNVYRVIVTKNITIVSQTQLSTEPTINDYLKLIGVSGKGV